MNCPKYCDVACSWVSRSNTTIQDVLVYRTEDSNDDFLPPMTSPGVTLEPDVNCNIEKTLAEQPTASCTLSLVCCNPPYCICIGAVDILSECRTIEVYGAHGEYLETCHGMRLEVNSDQKLYLCQYTLAESVSKCSIKLLSAVNKKQIWLHSLHITLETSQLPALSSIASPAIDVNKVKTIMAEMDTNIPDGARNLMATMEIMQKKRESNMGAMEGMLNAMIGLKGTTPQNGIMTSDADMPPALSSMMAMFAGLKPPGHQIGSEQHIAGNGQPAETSNTAFNSPKPPSCLSSHSMDRTEESTINRDLFSTSCTSEPFVVGVDADGTYPPQQGESIPGTKSESISRPPADSSWGVEHPSAYHEEQDRVHQNFSQQIASLENKLKHYIAQAVAESEQRIQMKLDRILYILQERQPRQTNGPPCLPGELDLD